MNGLKYTLILLALTLLLAACRDSAAEPTNAPVSEEPTAVAATADSPDTDADTGSEESEGQAAIATPEDESAEAEAESAATESDSVEVAPTNTPLPPAEPEEVTIEAADGLTIHGTFYPGRGQGARPGLLLLHMNGRVRQDWEEIAPQFAEAGYAALAVDMRGHGQTGSSKDWDLARDDLQRVWAYLVGREDVDESRTGIVGASVGANMALVTAAAEPAIKTVVLLSPGLNYLGVTTDDEIVAYGERPLFIVASEEDTQAADSSRALQELALGEAQLQMYDGAGHGTSMFGPQPELTDSIVNWLDKHVKGETAAVGSGTANLPAPTLFDVAWDDRTAFQAGLIGSEAGVLEQLPGASVYHMDLAISPDLQSVAGRQEVRFTNQEDIALDEVYFHLYPNLLGGSVNVSGLTVNGQVVEPELTADQTVLRVPLSTSLAPGEQVVIGMEYLVEVPTEGGSNYGVFAAIDGVLALAHFYPQIAVYDDEGWDIEKPSANADVTYADTSFYLVRVTVPAGQVVVASGSEIDRQIAGDEQTLTLAAGPMRDFYIASSDHYEVTSRSIGQTEVNSYGFPEFSERNGIVLDVSAAALESFNGRFGPYPFTEFDIAPTPNLALGVEYPGVAVVNSSLYDPAQQIGNTPSGFYLESTVAHEVAHQWFYSLVGNDQPDEPWLDESLTQYATYLYHVDAHGERNAEGFRQSFSDRWNRVDRAEIPVGMPAGDYEGSEYSAIIYGRGPLFFEALGEAMGAETFSVFLQDYYQQNKWLITTGAELKALAEAHCGCDLTALFDEWVGDL